MNAYNYEQNLLEIKDKYNNNYRLELRGNKNLVKGNSGTGKTYLVDLIKSIKENKVQSEYNVDNIEILNNLNLCNLKTFKNKLILIDKAEFILDTQNILYINSDTNNRYLIFSRVPLGIELSPNHQADFITDNGVTTMNYRFNVKGWC